MYSKKFVNIFNRYQKYVHTFYIEYLKIKVLTYQCRWHSKYTIWNFETQIDDRIKTMSLMVGCSLTSYEQGNYVHYIVRKSPHYTNTG